MTQEPIFEESSGNVFADLDLENADERRDARSLCSDAGWLGVRPNRLLYAFERLQLF